MSPLQKVLSSIFQNPWTSLVAVAALAALAIYGKVLTVPQIISYILTAVTAALAADGHNTGGTKE